MEFRPADANDTLDVYSSLTNERSACPIGRNRKEHSTWFYRWRVRSLRMQVGDAVMWALLGLCYLFSKS